MTLRDESFHNPFGSLAGRGEGRLFADPSLDDRGLIEQFFSGNEAAFAALVERHLPMVYKFAYRYVNDGDDARDIAQDSFIKAWKNLQKFDTARNFKTWLLTITKNTALDFIKKKKPVLFSKIEEGDGDLDAFLAPYIATAELPSDVMEGKFAAAELAGALERIPSAYRTVLALRYEEHLKFREIAEVLNEPIDTVKSKHRRGLMLLRNLMQA